MRQKEVNCPLTKASYMLSYEQNGNGSLTRKKDEKKTARYLSALDETQIHEAGEWVRLSDGDVLEKAFCTGFHYVYALIDPESQTPFYIGKGSQNRATDHFVTSGVEAGDVYNDMDNETKEGKIRSLLNEKYELKDIIRVVARNIDEKSAFDIEALLIHQIYNPDTLTNKQSGHERNNIRPFGQWSYIEGFDPITNEEGMFTEMPTAYKEHHYVYTLVNPENNNTPFYIGKGTGMRIQQHFGDARLTKKKTQKLSQINELVAKGYKQNDIGKILAYTSSPVSSFMLESFYLKFALRLSDAVTNEVMGHYQQNFRANGDWELRRGFDLRIVVEKGAKREDLEDTFLGLQLDTLLEQVKDALHGISEIYQYNFENPKVADAGELAIYATINSHAKLKVFARPSRKVQVEVRPICKETIRKFFHNIIGSATDRVLRGDGVFKPGIWHRKPTADITEAARRAALLIDLMSVENKQQLTAELLPLLEEKP